MEIHFPKTGLVAGDITLRSWQKSDAAAFVALASDAEIIRWTRIPQDYTEEKFLSRLHHTRAEEYTGRGMYCAIIHTETGVLMGACDLIIRSEEDMIGELGYLLGKDHRGAGVMARAVCLLAEWGFKELGLARIQMTTALENIASQKVARAAGFECEGTLRCWKSSKAGNPDRLLFSKISREARQPLRAIPKLA